METVKLDGLRLTNRAEAMDCLGRTLAFPEWWGRNLDALYDCLTDLDHPVELVLENRAAMEESSFGLRLLQVMEDAARTTPWLNLTTKKT